MKGSPVHRWTFVHSVIMIERGYAESRITHSYYSIVALLDRWCTDTIVRCLAIDGFASADDIGRDQCIQSIRERNADILFQQSSAEQSIGYGRNMAV